MKITGKYHRNSILERTWGSAYLRMNSSLNKRDTKTLEAFPYYV